MQGTMSTGATQEFDAPGPAMDAPDGVLTRVYALKRARMAALVGSRGHSMTAGHLRISRAFLGAGGSLDAPNASVRRGVPHARGPAADGGLVCGFLFPSVCCDFSADLISVHSPRPTHRLLVDRREKRVPVPS